jgi:NAD(P)-dependent dehydrogenase (short-subunit alcohol dehydrogenase family)
MSERSFGVESTTDDVLQGIDLTGRVALVTGASGGLGAETARALAARGCAVTLAARDVPRAEKVADAIRQAHPRAQLDVGELELSRPASVEDFASRWRAEHAVLNLLILNAGVMACPLQRTPEGRELQFATNHLGHFLLTARLMDALRAGAPSRVVVLSSGGHVRSPVVFDDIHFEAREYDPWSGYGQAKTANVLFALELDRRYRDAGVRAFSVHPGMIQTDLGRHLTPEAIAQIRAQATGGGEPRKTVEQGAATSCWAATAAELADRGGLYLVDCAIAGPRPEDPRGYAEHALDPAAAARLWEVSQEMLGRPFPGA